MYVLKIHKKTTIDKTAVRRCFCIPRNWVQTGRGGASTMHYYLELCISRPELEVESENALLKWCFPKVATLRGARSGRRGARSGRIEARVLGVRGARSGSRGARSGRFEARVLGGEARVLGKFEARVLGDEARVLGGCTGGWRGPCPPQRGQVPFHPCNMQEPQTAHVYLPRACLDPPIKCQTNHSKRGRENCLCHAGRHKQTVWAWN